MKVSVKRPRLIRRFAKKPGAAPGTLVYVGEKKLETVRITYMDYDEQNFEEKQISSIEECLPFRPTPTVTWINIDGLHEVQIIEKLGKQFELHPLILEDILNTDQRPKMEDFEKYLFLVLKMLTYKEEEQAIHTEQISLVLGSNFVISFQENIGDVFEPIRNRLRNAKGKIRKMGSDYLMYALLDSVVDGYFTILEKLGDKIESLEEQLVSDPTEKTLHEIHELKREMISLRRSVWPLRETVSGLQRTESNLIKDGTRIYLRDVYDHTIQVIDTIESYRDMVSGMLDIYMSSISNKMNSVMKVLTIIATIFIPLTFIVGIYGMNFKHMPELEWRWGYPAVGVIMIAVLVSMLIYFKKRNWL